MLILLFKSVALEVSGTAGNYSKAGSGMVRLRKSEEQFVRIYSVSPIFLGRVSAINVL